MAKVNLQPILDEVDKLPSVVDSVVLLMNNLAQRVLNSPTLEEAKEVATQIRTQSDALAAAVVAHTPSDENPENPPVEPPVEPLA